MKDPDTDNLDAGWDALEPAAPPGGAASAAEPDELDDLDAGWEDDPAPVTLVPAGQERAARAVVNGDRLSKRERRAFERKKRLAGEKRRAERRAEEKRERRDAARRAAEERQAERLQTLERAERAKKKAKRPAEGPSPRPAKAGRAEQSKGETQPKTAPEGRARFVMPNGGWIIVVLALITLGTAWFAFAR